MKSYDLTSFKENFYECVDNGKTLDFKSTGKYFFFVTTNTEYLNSVKDAIGANDVVSYSDFKANPTNYVDGRYIISDANICDILYKGEHSLDASNSNPCAGICTKCGELAQAQNPKHNFTITISYENYCAKGTKSQLCSNENCKYNKEPLESDVNGIISEFKGISTKIDGDGLTFGFSIDYDALDEYVKVNGDVEIGFVVAVKNFLDVNMPLDESGNPNNEKVVKASLLKWTQNDEGNKSVTRYTTADFKIVGAWDKYVDFDGDGALETSVKDVEFYMSGYIIDGNTVKYINYNSSSDIPYAVTYNNC